MGSKKLVLCCILGIVAGYLAPLVFSVARSTSLSIGMVAGLGIGYLLDILDERKGKEADTAVISQKARKANQLMERARAELDGRELPAADEPDAEDESAEENEYLKEDPDPEEQAEKLNEAEDLLRKAREKIR